MRGRSSGARAARPKGVSAAQTEGDPPKSIYVTHLELDVELRELDAAPIAAPEPDDLALPKDGPRVDLLARAFIDGAHVELGLACAGRLNEIAVAGEQPPELRAGDEPGIARQSERMVVKVDAEERSEEGVRLGDPSEFVGPKDARGPDDGVLGHDFGLLDLPTPAEASVRVEKTDPAPHPRPVSALVQMRQRPANVHVHADPDRHAEHQVGTCREGTPSVRGQLADGCGQGPA